MGTEFRFHFEAKHDAENELNAYVENGVLRIGVAEERAVDSYNQVFECEVFLPPQDAARLRDFLIRALPPN